MAKTTSRSAESGRYRSTERDAKSGKIVERNSKTGAFLSNSGAKRFSVSTDRNGVTVVKIK